MLQMYQGLKRKDVENAKAGDIVAIAGLETINVGDTVSDVANPIALPPLDIDEPTLSMEFTINNSPFSGREGKLVTSRHLRERLLKEQQINVGLKSTVPAACHCETWRAARSRSTPSTSFHD